MTEQATIHAKSAPVASAQAHPFHANDTPCRIASTRPYPTNISCPLTSIDRSSPAFPTSPSNVPLHYKSVQCQRRAVSCLFSPRQPTDPAASHFPHPANIRLFPIPVPSFRYLSLPTYGPSHVLSFPPKRQALAASNDWSCLVFPPPVCPRLVNLRTPSAHHHSRQATNRIRPLLDRPNRPKRQAVSIPFLSARIYRINRRTKSNLSWSCQSTCQSTYLALSNLFLPLHAK